MTLYRAWLAGSVALLAAIAWHQMELLGDAFWCMAAGDLVLDTGKLPDRDVFAFSSMHGPWILHMPAFQIGAAWLARRAGVSAVLVACAIVAASAAVVAWLPHARTRAAKVATFPLALFYLVLDADDFSARGQVFGDLAFAILVILLVRSRRAPPSGVRPRLIALVAPFALGAAWANLHPSFLLAIVVPIAFAVASLLDPPEHRPPLAPFTAFSVAALAGACVNPYFSDLVIDVVKLAADPTTGAVDLFRSPDFHRPLWMIAPAVALAIVAVRTRFGPDANRRADVALLLLFVAATCVARRYGTLLVAFELAVAGGVASDALTIPAWARRAARPATIVATLAQLAVVAVLARERKDPFANVPVAAARVVEARKLPDRVMNPYAWGGYLDWAWKGRRKVFVDGRNNLFANGVFDDATRVAWLEEGWGDLLDAYEIRTVLWQSGAPLDVALAHDEDWKEVHRDDRAVVYVRRR